MVPCGLRPEAADAELRPELRVLHDVWSGGTELAHVSDQHGKCKSSVTNGVCNKDILHTENTPLKVSYAYKSAEFFRSYRCHA